MEHPDSLYRMIKKFYLPKYMRRTDTSEGETPDATIKISDVKMVKKTVAGTKVKKSYTSVRISTQN